MSPYVNNPPYPNNYGPKFLVIEKGDGVWLYDKKGKKYLDFGSGIAVNSLGYAREDLAKAAYDQMMKVTHTSNLFATEPALTLAENLVKTGDFAAVHFGNSGTEANEAAFKYARAYSLRKKGEGHHKILSFTEAFHGRTFGTMSATPKMKYKAPFAPLVPGFETITFNDVDELKKTLDTTYAGVIVEPIQGEGGINRASEEFVEALNTLCKELDIILIADEVQTGMGRTGYFYGSELVGLKPDIITLSKPLAGGLPLSATLIPGKVNDVIKVGEHGTTFGGGPVTTAVALKVWEEVSDKEFLKKVQEKGNFFKDELAKLKNEFSFLGEIKGEGLLLGIQLKDSEKIPKVMELCAEKGLLILRAGEDILRFAPPLVINEEEIKEGLAILKEALKEII